METSLEHTILAALHARSCRHRTAVSLRFPFTKPYIITAKRAWRTARNRADFRIARRRSGGRLPAIVARHQSVLRRPLGESDPRLQEQKIVNLRQAISCLDGLIIRPGEVFSLWSAVSKPTYAKGYVDGMLLANGEVITGVGGGLCQLSNFLFWIMLHAPMRVIERYHHSMDVFPDSGRTLPFGSGATVLYNFVDLKMQNVSDQPLQLKLWLTDKHLKGTLRTVKPFPNKFHLHERNHAFCRYQGRYFRYNELWREERVNGLSYTWEHITTNLAPVLYPVDAQQLQLNHTFYDFDTPVPVTA